MPGRRRHPGRRRRGIGPLSPAPHPSRPPELGHLLGALSRHRVRYILGGSTAALAYGVSLEPGDLDIIPDTAPENLARLAALLEEVEARPQGPFGNWVEGDRGEQRWVPRPTTREELESWSPDPHDPASFDHLLTTRHGNLDVVPALMGSFATLGPRAVTAVVAGHEIRVVHVDEVLAGMTIPRRDKDVPRVAALRALQRRGGPGDAPPPASPPGGGVD